MKILKECDQENDQRYTVTDLACFVTKYGSFQSNFLFVGINIEIQTAIVSRDKPSLFRAVPTCL